MNFSNYLRLIICISVCLFFSVSNLLAQVNDQKENISTKDSIIQKKREEFFKRGFAAQRKMNSKYENAVRKEEMQMDSIYQLILVRYNQDTFFVRKLKKSQALWEKLVDANMEAIFPRAEDSALYYYGQVLPICELGIRGGFIHRRIAFLITWLKGIPEGDACPGSAKINRGEYMSDRDSTYNPFFRQ